MLTLLIILMVMVGTLGGATALHALEQNLKKTPELEAPVEKDEPQWLEEEWHNQQYVDMIHRTRELEQENYGYVISSCFCTYHDNLAKQNAEAEKIRLEREHWLSGWTAETDIDAINEATRAQKLVTYRTYYNSKDEPGYKSVEQLNFEKWRDSSGREHLRAMAVPSAHYGTISAGTINPSYVPDPYSERMRLKDELKGLEWQLSRISRGFDYDRNAYTMHTREFEQYKKVSDRIRQVKSQLSATTYDDGRYVEKRYRRGGEVEEYVMQDAYGKVIKRWREGVY